MPPAARPMPPPIAVSLSLVSGTAVTVGRQLILKPQLLVVLREAEWPKEWPMRVPIPRPAPGNAFAGIFQGVAFIAFQGDGAGDWGDVTVGEGDSHGLQAEFAAVAFAHEAVEFALDESAGGDDDFIAGGDGRSNLGVDVVAAAEVAGLQRLRENQRDAGSGRDGDENVFSRSGLFHQSWGIVLLVWLRRGLLGHSGDG
jgi:hypothetical protein